MPRTNITLNLPGFSIKKTRGYDPIIYEVNYNRISRCPYCYGKKLRYKDKFIRYIEHESIGTRRVLLEVTIKKYRCYCCNKYFRQRFEGILPWQRITERLKKYIYQQHSQGITRKDLSNNYKKSDSTISNCYNYVYNLEDKKRSTMQLPRVLGIDEHYFSKKQRIYATTLCDLEKNRIFDVVEGKSHRELKDYFDNLEGKDRVKVVCMDLSNPYRSLINHYFPNAKIVSDRFHVIKLLIYHLIETAKAICPDLKKNKSIIKALRTHKSNLQDSQKQLLDSFLKDNPAVDAVYNHKEEWIKLLLNKKKTKVAARPLAHNFFKLLNQLKQIPVESARTLAKTLDSWKEEIARMWRFTKNNGITEGFHRKMKLIQRQAYGFRNFDNYRKRVRVSCM
jgi:transposase